jgi:peroxiredoxin
MSIKHAIVVSLLLSCSSGYCQKAQHSIVSGNLNFLKAENRMLEVTYRKIGGGYQFDSTSIINGQFKIEKELSEPVVVIMSVMALPGVRTIGQGTLDYLSILLTPGKELEISGASSLKGASISGSGAAVNGEYKDYLNQLNMYIARGNSAVMKLKDLGLDSVERDKRITDIRDSINLERDQNVYLRFVNSKPQSPVAALALLGYAGEPVWRPRKKMSPEEIENLLKLFPKEALDYPSFSSLKEELQVSKATGYGKPIIDFALNDTSGKAVRLSDFRGKYVFLDFWASWCVPCRKENPNVKKQFEKYKDRGFTVVSVSLDKPDARQAWIDAVRKDGTGIWTQLGDLHGFDGDVAKSYYVRSIPTNFLIGPDGKFLDRNLYGEELGKKLSKIFVDNK